MNEPLPDDEWAGMFERVIVCAAGHGHVFGPSPADWPEFAVRECEAWLRLARERDAVPAPPEGAPSWEDLANLLVEIDAAEFAADNCAECERIRDVAEDSSYYCADHSARVREARSAQGRFVALLSRIPKEVRRDEPT